MIQRLLILIVISCIFTTANISCNSKSGKRKTDVIINTTENLHEYLEVNKVVDGDTFWADDGSEKGVKIRLIGVDAPESRKVFKKEVGFYGKEAKAHLVNLLKNRQVRLEYDVDQTDRYGRDLAYVHLEDGTFLNAELVKNGYAVVMTILPNVKYAAEFVILQKEARENSKGLWGEGNSEGIGG